MILEVYSVMDRAVKAYLPPFYCRSRGEALRSFSDAVNDPKHQFHIHVEDYGLVYLGCFDDGSGTFRCVEPERVVSALECIVDDAPGPERRSKVG